MQRTADLLPIRRLFFAALVLLQPACSLIKPAKADIDSVDWSRESVRPRLFVSTSAELASPAALLLPSHVERVLHVSEDMLAFAERNGPGTVLPIREGVLQGGPCAGTDHDEIKQCVAIIPQRIRGSDLALPYILELKIPGDGGVINNSVFDKRDDYYRIKYLIVTGRQTRQIAECSIRAALPGYGSALRAPDEALEACRIEVLQSRLFQSLGSG